MGMICQRIPAVSRFDRRGGGRVRRGGGRIRHGALSAAQGADEKPCSFEAGVMKSRARLAGTERILSTTRSARRAPQANSAAGGVAKVPVVPVESSRNHVSARYAELWGCAP